MLNRNFYSSYIHFRDKYVQNPATCLPHIVIENCLKLLKTTLSQVRKSGCFSAVFANYSKPTEVFWSIQFPYGSPHTRLSNDDISPFESFYFTLIRLLSFTCPLYSFGLSFARVVLLEVKHRCDSISCSRLSLIKHMTVDRSRGSYRRVT